MSGTISRTSCSVDEVAQRGDVAGVVDARHERAAVGVVERRRELVDVGRRSWSRRRARNAVTMSTRWPAHVKRTAVTRAQRSEAAPGHRPPPRRRATSRVTTAPAPTRAPRPIVTPPRITAPEPIEAPSSTRTRRSDQSSSLASSPAAFVARGCLSLTKSTPWPTKTSSPISTPSQTKEWLGDLAALADHRPALDLDERTDSRLVADRAAVEVRERVDDDPLAELDVGDQPERRVVRRSGAHTAAFTIAATRSTSSASSSGNIGSESADAAHASAAGNAPGRRAPARRAQAAGAAEPGSASRSRSFASPSASRTRSRAALRITYRCQTGLRPVGDGAAWSRRRRAAPCTRPRDAAAARSSRRGAAASRAAPRPGACRGARSRRSPRARTCGSGRDRGGRGSGRRARRRR